MLRGISTLTLVLTLNMHYHQDLKLPADVGHFLAIGPHCQTSWSVEHSLS